MALRAGIVLQAAQGASNKDIAASVGTSPQAVGLWRGRFARHGVAGLHDDSCP